MSKKNRFQKAKMKKRNNLIMSYVKKGYTYKNTADILKRHKIKMTSQRIGQIVKDYEAQQVTRPEKAQSDDLEDKLE